MGIFSIINTSGSGLTAQRTRLDVIADNIANVNTTRTTEGGAFRRSRVLFKPRDDGNKYRSPFLPEALQPNVGTGVRVFSIEKDMETATRFVYDPSHPDAIKYGEKAGYVEMPNVNPVTEMVDMIAVTRAYETNQKMVQTIDQTLDKAVNEIGRL